jgi:tRNA(fMet)-specific endonuclease VapC
LAIVVDTSVFIAIERQILLDPRPDSLRSVAPNAAVSVVTLMELRIGLLLADSEARRVARQEFAEIVTSNFAVLPLREREAFVAADILVALHRTGQRIGERDLLIAATALAGNHAVMTLNRAEFERVPGLSVLSPPLPPRP